MPLAHSWIQYNINFPALQNHETLFPINDNNFPFFDFGTVDPTTLNVYNVANMGVRFSGGNVNNIKIWLDSSYTDLYPRVGTGNTWPPQIRVAAFDPYDNDYFHMQYIIISGDSSSSYNTFIGAATTAASGGFNIPLTENNAINFGKLNLYVYNANLYNNFSYSPILAIKIFHPENSTSFLNNNWEIRNFRLRLEYDGIL